MVFEYEKKESKIHGQGIFSNKDIPKSEKFYVIPLKIISNETKPKYARIGSRYVSDEVLNWINHSCEPNSRLIVDDEPYLVSLKNIPKGEEITLNYNETELHNKKIKCNCKSKNCNGFFFIS